MHWIKKGLLYSTDGKYEWSRTHAAVPFTMPMGEDRIKIFFSTRDSINRSYTSWIECGVNGGRLEILRVADHPTLTPGQLGCFDDSGAMGSCIVRHGEETRMYYIGWNLGTTVSFRNSIGLAISKDSDVFYRISEGPVVERNIFDPYFVVSPFVLWRNEKWNLWYASGQKWEKNDKLQPFYHICYAWSEDGVNWNREGIVCIDFKSKKEYAIARPCVLAEPDLYKMWYCYRASQQAQTYRIGYAESSDGLNWIRLDEQAGIDVSPTGWDSEMICYPWVFRAKNKLFMLYNGNGYGRTGFGYAVAEVQK